jgi:hypothetical protein
VQVKPLTAQRFTNFYSCPAHGSIVYVSDAANNIIYGYAGKFLGQGPCAQIGIGHLNFPWGLHVDTATHDLYVANMRDFDVLVFHRGQTTAYNAYSDASGQLPQDVTLAPDGTVIASNAVQYGGPEAGSLSTWIKGANGGTFVGNFPMTNDTQGGYLAVKASGIVYFNDVDSNSNDGALWKVSCPAGVCGLQTLAGISFLSPGGLAIDRTGDLLAIDPAASTADTFELPNPKPKTFSLVAGSAIGLAINATDRFLFAADPDKNSAAEYRYPSGTLVGTVPGNQGGFPVGIAIDP